MVSIGGDADSLNAALPDHVYMDAMAFGMGCCCLQMTFQVYVLNAKQWHSYTNSSVM